MVFKKNYYSISPVSKLCLSRATGNNYDLDKGKAFFLPDSSGQMNLFLPNKKILLFCSKKPLATSFLYPETNLSLWGKTLSK